MTRQYNSFGRDQINIENLHGNVTIVNHDRKKVAGPDSEQVSQGIPHNLTLIVGAATFVGREDDMKLLHEQLQQGTTVAISAVAGMGGVGKTELALQYALRHLELQTYSGGVCWLAARQDVGLQLVTFARSGLDLQPPDDLELVDRVRWCWQRWEGAVLLVLDDVQEYQTIQPYLPPNEARFKVVLTSRSTFGSPVRNLELKVLTEWAALELLRSLVTDGRIDEQLEQAKWICGWLGCLPLGLELVGRYLAQKPDLSLEKLRQRLEEKRLEAKALKDAHPEMTATLGVAAAFELSWQELDGQAQGLAMLLSLFALAEIPWELVQACVRLDEEDLEDLRDGQLLRLHLLERTKDRTYQLHQLLREFFAAKLEPMEFADDLKRAACAVLVAVARQIPPTPTLTDLAQAAPAIPHLKEAATTLQPWLTDADLITPATRLGWFYAGQSAFTEAKDWYKHSRHQAETRLGADHPDIAISLNNLANLCYSQGHYAEAEPFYRQALTISQQQLGDDHPNVATSLNNLAFLYKAQGRYSEAEPLYLQALSIRQQQLGDDHPNVASSLNNLAELYYSQGRYPEAGTLYLRSLSIRQQQLGKDHIDVAQTLSNLAELHWAQGRYVEAELLHLRSLSIRKQQLGIDHPTVAASLNNLALLYNSQGRYTEAEPLYLQSLSIDQRCYGDEHPNVATSLNNLAGLYELQGRYTEAETLHLRSLSIREQQLGKDHSDVAQSLNNLALLYNSQKRYTEAEPLYLRTISIVEQQLGTNHPNLAQSLNNLAALYQDQGRYTEAEPLYLRAISIFVNCLGENHPSTETVIGRFAHLLQQAIQSGRTAELSDHPITQNLLQQIQARNSNA